MRECLLVANSKGGIEMLRSVSLNAMIAVAIAISAGARPAQAQDAGAGVSPELTARMAAEKDARRACKVDICKAIATPSTGPIKCEVTKTWLKREIIARIVGGSYVWGYGNMQCTLSLDLDRAELAKTTGDGASKATFAEQKVVCKVDDADAAKGMAFEVKMSGTPAVTLEKGDAKSVDLQSVKTEGSSVASAAVSSIMAIDKVSGLISRAAATEMNDFVYVKCKADGVEITRKP